MPTRGVDHVDCAQDIIDTLKVRQRRYCCDMRIAASPNMLHQHGRDSKVT